MYFNNLLLQSQFWLCWLGSVACENRPPKWHASVSGGTLNPSRSLTHVIGSGEFPYIIVACATQVRPAAAAAASAATRSAGTRRESVFPAHDRQHSDGKAALRHVQELGGELLAGRPTALVLWAIVYSTQCIGWPRKASHVTYYRILQETVLKPPNWFFVKFKMSLNITWYWIFYVWHALDVSYCAWPAKLQYALNELTSLL